MLPTHLFSQNINRIKIVLPYQWLNITFVAIRSNSSKSGSSSDSDSDSDSAKKHSNKSQKFDYLRGTQVAQKKKQIEKQIMQAAQLLTQTSGREKEKIVSTLLNTVSRIQTEDTNVLLKGKTGQKKNIKQQKYVEEYEESKERKNLKKFQKKQLVSDVREPRHNEFEEPSIIQMLKRQGAKLKSDKIEEPKLSSNVTDEPSVIRKLRDQQRKDRKDRNVIGKIETKQEVPNEKSVIQMLKDQQQDNKFKQYHHRTEISDTPKELSTIRIKRRERRMERDFDDMSKRKYEILEGRTGDKLHKDFNESSVSNLLRSQMRTTRKQRYEVPEDEASRKMENQISLSRLLSSSDDGKGVNDKEFNWIFINKFTENPDIPALKVWNMCEEKELKIMVKRHPRNAFQEMIDWTNEGKLWQFPINNEQGMKEEENVHFSKHVFLERQLSPWCPTKGPIRHFMELVCCGLSKNPYLTIQEKYDHIMWYKDYFKDKQDLLYKLGLVEDKKTN